MDEHRAGSTNVFLEDETKERINEGRNEDLFVPIGHWMEQWNVSSRVILDSRFVFIHSLRIAMADQERSTKMEIDYSSVVDLKLKEFDEIMKDPSKLSEVLERLLPLEKQTRTVNPRESSLSICRVSF